MRRIAVLSLPLLAFFFSGCTDQATAPDLDLELTAAYKKPPKPPKPPPTPTDPFEFISIETSFRPLVGAFTCAIEDSDGDGVGPVYCWGNNSHYSLGLGGKKKRDKKTPTEPAGGDGFIVSEVHLGNLFACAIEDPDGNGQGPVYCWGQNAHGELGDGTTKLRSSPTQIASDLEFFALDAGAGEACALTDIGGGLGAMYCWGGGSLVPIHVAVDKTFRDFSDGTWGTYCGIDESFAAWCWYGSPENHTTPGMVLEESQVETRFHAIGSSLGDTCGLTTDGRILCWYVPGFEVESPEIIYATEISLGDAAGEGGFSAISAGFCAIGSNTGRAYCWGRNDDGQVGDGSEPTGMVTRVDVPTAVSTPHYFSRIGDKNFHTCGIATDGFAYCWGSNGSGELGNGTLQDSSVPVKVAGQ